MKQIFEGRRFLKHKQGISCSLTIFTVKQIEVIQEVVSPEVSKLNDRKMNKKRGDQIQFSPEKKTLKKRKWIYHHSSPNNIIIPVHGLCFKIIDSSILKEIFSSVSKCLSCTGEKTELK